MPVYDQVNTCSCLTLILAGIVYWQARGISRITAAPDFLPFVPELLRHVSPIEWKSVILYDESKIDETRNTAFSRVLRPSGGEKGRLARTVH